jgi:hypothetical protein
MDGSEVHRWDHNGFPSRLLDPALIAGKRGHVMVWLFTMTGSQTGAIPGLPIAMNKVIGELDWDGAVVWQWGKPLPAAGRNSTMTGAVYPMATRWYCPR